MKALFLVLLRKREPAVCLFRLLARLINVRAQVFPGEASYSLGACGTFSQNMYTNVGESF